MSTEILVIDLFSGPGGLGEGFSAFRDRRQAKPFNIAMSVEKEPSAHRTLELRAFIRQFEEAPEKYYDYVRGECDRQSLFDHFPRQAAAARQETLGGPKKLGKDGNDEEIYRRLKQIRRAHKGHLVVVGGPPCQAYSLMGRARNKGIKDYKEEEDERFFLYKEYLKVLTCVKPDAFIMENVAGILSATVKKELEFPKILHRLKDPNRALGKRTNRNCRYRLYSMVTGCEIEPSREGGAECKIRSEEYGVPQTRHRVIVLGVHEDVRSEPGVLVPAGRVVTVREAISDLPRLRSGITRITDDDKVWSSAIAIQAKTVTKEIGKRGLNTTAVASAAKRASSLKSRGNQFVKSNSRFKGPDHLNAWIIDRKIGGFLNHDTRGHMAPDLGRYLYCTSFALQNKGLSPRSRNFPEALAPDHKSWESGKFADRFKVQAGNRPASTVTSHISKDGHANIHYDPSQCRSLTVREAARLQTFPDNYFFEGNRTEQYVQVGNAVPPWLATQIAKVVYELL